MRKGHVLIVDDEPSISTTLEGILTDEGYDVSMAENGTQALELVKSNSPDIILLDIWMPGLDGIEVLKAIKEFQSDLEVIIMSGHGSIDTAVRATKLGAFDFIEKPLSLENVLTTITHAIEQQRLIRENLELKKELIRKHEIIGENPSIAEIRGQIKSAYETSKNILITGENGTGKELIARVIHAESRRRNKPFIKINCSILSEDTLESQLFGFEDQNSQKGETFKRGKFEIVEGGTLFLDEVDKISPEIQKKIIEVFESKKLKRRGGKRNIPIDFRLISASNKDISEEVKLGNFDSEFYKILSEISIFSPSLRDRKDDIPLLANYLMKEFCEEYAKNIKEFDDEAMVALSTFNWPGNVKELKNIIERLVITVPMAKVTLNDIPAGIRGEKKDISLHRFEGYSSIKEAQAAWEKEFITYHLKKNEWDMQKTAKIVSIGKRSLEHKVKTLGINIGKTKSLNKRAQKTLKTSVVLCGQGLHSGLKTGLILIPQPPNSGITFGNISTGETIPAFIDYVESTEFATSLRSGKNQAKTIEHIMAVLHTYGINNLLIKISDEVPIMDGSAKDFCELIEDGGLEEQDEYVEEIVIDDTYSIGDTNGKYISIEPAPEFSVHYIMDYPKPIGHQEFNFVLKNEKRFKEEIAPARTFCFLKDVEILEKKGYISGGRINNAILLDDEKVINTELRFSNEFVRHKILDILGDFYLLGRPIKGKITAKLSGHSDNIALLNKIKKLC